MNGAKYLNKLYPNLNLSTEVQKTSTSTKDKNESVTKYMELLEKIHKHATSNPEFFKILKEMYYKKYIIKEENIPDYMDKQLIINQQKESLDSWLEYLLDKDNPYPMWTKYWVFQGMIKIGTYDEVKEIYQKRSKKTLAPFIELNHEIVSKCMSLVTEYTNKKEISDKKIEKLIVSGNFGKLYTLFLKTYKKRNILENKTTDGIWIKYQKETEEEITKKETSKIEPEYLKLYNSLQGYNTSWCTAGGKDTAKQQLLEGDFYVYYTKNKNNEYKIPRIAIRKSNNYIIEIRGIEESQNIEEGLEEIIEKKLKTFNDLSNKEINNKLKIINDMNKLTLLNKKSSNNEEFTLEELKFIYQIENSIESFGYYQDPRIEKIISKREIEKDLNLITDDQIQKIHIWTTYLKYLPNRLRNNKEFITKMIENNHNPSILLGASNELKSDKGFISNLIEKTKYKELLYYADDSIKNDKEFVLSLIEKYKSTSIIYEIGDRLKNDKDFIIYLIEKYKEPNLIALNYELSNDKIFILELIKTYGVETFKYVNTKIGMDTNFILELMKYDISIIKEVHWMVYSCYKDFSKQIIKENVLAYKYLPEKEQTKDSIKLLVKKELILQSIKNKLNIKKKIKTIQH